MRMNYEEAKNSVGVFGLVDRGDTIDAVYLDGERLERFHYGMSCANWWPLTHMGFFSTADEANKYLAERQRGICLGQALAENRVVFLRAEFGEMEHHPQNRLVDYAENPAFAAGLVDYISTLSIAKMQADSIFGDSPVPKEERDKTRRRMEDTIRKNGKAAAVAYAALLAADYIE